MASRVTVNTETLGIAWTAGQQFRIALQEDFVREVGNTESPNPANSNLYTFITNAAGPTIIETTPVDNTAAATGNVNARLTISFNRKVKAGSGNVQVYQIGSPDILLLNVPVSDPKISFVDNECRINVTGLMRASTSYYVRVDNGAITDRDGFVFTGINNNTTFNFTTAASTNVLFRDLSASINANITLASTPFIKEPTRITMSRQAEFSLVCNAIAVTPNTAYLLDATGTYLYVEDTGSQLAFVPKISDYLYVNAGGTGNYTLTITPDNVSAVSSMSATNATFNNTTKVLTFTGTINQINNSLDFVTFVPQTEFASSFALAFSVTTPQGNTQTKNLTVNLGTPLDIEITNMNVSRSYQTNRQNLIFASTTPFISDFDSTPNTQYTMTFTCANGFFRQTTPVLGVSELTPSENVFILTGNKTALNNVFASLGYFPSYNFSANTTFTFQLVKNNNTLANVTVNLTRIGNVENLLPTNLKIITVSPFAQNEVDSYSPTIEEILYGKAEILMIGKGGNGGETFGLDGGSAGGSAGEVLYLQNQTLTNQGFTAFSNPAVENYISGFISIQTASGEHRVRNGLNGRFMLDNEGYSQVNGVLGSTRNYSEYYPSTTTGDIPPYQARIDNTSLARRGMSNPINGALSATNTGAGNPVGPPYALPNTQFFSSNNGFIFGGSAGAGGAGTDSPGQVNGRVVLGKGGPGVTNSITGTAVTYAAGGPGGSNLVFNISIADSPISNTYGSGGRGQVRGDGIIRIFPTSGIKQAIILKITAR